MSWVAAAVAAGTGIYKAVDANQKKKRQEGYIGENERLARKKLIRQQADVRQGTSESLMARGMAQGGIRSAMSGAPHTLGEQVQADNETEFGLESTDLNNQVSRANQENTNARTGNYINAGIGVANGIMGAMTMNAERAGPSIGNGSIADASAPGSFGTSTIRAAMTGVDDPSHWFGGIVGGGADPLTAPGSSWNRGTRNAVGEPAGDFHV